LHVAGEAVSRIVGDHHRLVLVNHHGGMEPKISSLAIVISDVTFAKTVGRAK
jgi:hypothetical protein